MHVASGYGCDSLVTIVRLITSSPAVDKGSKPVYIYTIQRFQCRDGGRLDHLLNYEIRALWCLRLLSTGRLTFWDSVPSKSAPVAAIRVIAATPLSRNPDRTPASNPVPV